MSVATRREREKLERRAAILDAARELFYERGFQNTTVGEIAAAADLSKGTVYLYFASKDELYVSVVMESFQIVEDRLHEIMESGMSVREKGIAVYLAFVAHCMEHHEYFRMTQYLLTENARENIPAQLVERISDHTGRLLSYVAGLVAEGRRSGLIREDVDPYAFAVIAWRSATGLLDLAVVGDSSAAGAGPYPALFEQAIELLIAGAAVRGGPDALQGEQTVTG